MSVALILHLDTGRVVLAEANRHERPADPQVLGGAAYEAARWIGDELVA
jgi:hypothetical protein